MYFEQPDSSCHAEGPDSDLVKSGLIYVDSMINYLMYRLDKEGLLGCLNIVIVSDHGGQALESSKFLPVDDYLPVENDENMEVFGGAVGHLNFHNLAQVNATMLVDTFACKTNHSFRVFTKQTIPKRYHYTNSDRVGPLIFDGYPGARVFRTRKDAEELKDKGDHGYDNRNREMRAIFGGYGPDIREKTIIPPFQNIELYNLMSDLLRLPFSAPNNGTRGVLYNVLRRPPDVVETEVVELHPCENADLVKCGDGCYFKLDLIPHDRDAAADCQRLTPIDASQHTADTLDLCALDFCNATMAFSRRLLMPMFVESILTAPLQNIDHRANCSAWVRIRVPQNRILSPSNVTMSSLFEPDAAGEAEAEEGSPPPSANDALSNAEMTNWKVVGAQGRNRRNEKSAGRYSADVIGAEEVREGKQDKEKEEEERMDEAKLCLSAKATKGQRWISLFPDNDYTRYVVQGQVRVPTGFYNGPWKHMLDLVVKYQRHYRKIVMYAGPIFDRRNSGVADDDILHPRESAYFDSTMNTMRPTHIFLILLRCPGAKWQADFRACERTEDTSTLAFMLPLIEKEDNCLFVEEYLFMNTCRIRDIELLTHLEWFTDRRVYSAETALRLRTAIPEQLWQLEVDAQQRRSGESG